MVAGEFEGEFESEKCWLENMYLMNGKSEEVVKGCTEIESCGSCTQDGGRAHEVNLSPSLPTKQLCFELLLPNLFIWTFPIN